MNSLVGFTGDTVIKNLPVNAGDTGDLGSIPGSGRSPGVGNGNPLQYSCLENSMDKGDWQATVCHVGVSESNVTKHAHIHTHTHSYSQEPCCWMEKVLETHPSTLAWKIPWTEEPGRLQSMRSLRVGGLWSDLAIAAAACCLTCFGHYLIQSLRWV